MNRFFLVTLILAVSVLWLAPEVAAQRGGRGGGGQRGFGTGYGGTMRTGYGSGFETGYGGGFGTGYGGTMHTGYGARPGYGYGGAGFQAGTGRVLGPYSQAGTGRALGPYSQAGTGRALGPYSQAGTGVALNPWTQAGTGRALGPYSQAGTGRAAYPGTPGTGAIGTYHRTNGEISGQASAARVRFNNYNCFRPDWYARYPRAWFPVAWPVMAAWNYTPWTEIASFTSYPDTQTFYDYGTSVVYQDNQVYMNGDSLGTQEEYAHNASLIAEAGRKANVTREEEWKSLGVFSMLASDEVDPHTIIQLAINKQGVLRGTSLNTITNEAQTVYGSVGTKTERAAWTVGDEKLPVYEAGIANLTLNETTMLVHFSKGNTKQYTLARMEAPAELK
ncbi:MAG: hypothetical protein JNJ77_19690 [Planctomycetia bacterium]|nr:hypothetical protein [Planctomycetia bacterium]